MNADPNWGQQNRASSGIRIPTVPAGIRLVAGPSICQVFCRPAGMVPVSTRGRSVAIQQASATARQGHTCPFGPARSRGVTLNAWYAAQTVAGRDMLIVDPATLAAGRRREESALAAEPLVYLSQVLDLVLQQRAVTLLGVAA